MVEWRPAPRRGRPERADRAATRSPGRSSEQVENERLRRENERLAGELAKARAALDVVGEAHALLELLSESAEPDQRSKP